MQANSSTEEEIFRVRKLDISDKKKGFIELLQQLTVCDSISDEAFRERFLDLATHGDDHLICVIEDHNSGKIVATGSVFIEKKFLRNCGKVGHVEDVVVDSSVRGKQLGKNIVEFLSDHARQMGCYKVILDCSLANMTFYEKCGFKQKEVQMLPDFCSTDGTLTQPSKRYLAYPTKMLRSLGSTPPESSDLRSLGKMVGASDQLENLSNESSSTF